MWVAISVALSAGYFYILIRYVSAWNGMKSAIGAAGTDEDAPLVSVVLPARNEQAGIASCLESLLAQNYPNFECILVDDHSEDDTYAIVASFLDTRLRLAKQEEGKEGKKAAISTGIKRAGGEVIVTTDADCRVGSGWLSAMVNALRPDGRRIVTGPVLVAGKVGYLTPLQQLELLGLNLVTGAGIAAGYHKLGNGANLAFYRDDFLTVGGYAGNDHILSGDDLFLIEKMEENWPGSLGYCKSRDAVVYTDPEPSYRTFLSQRLRWASKNGLLKDRRIQLVWAGIWGVNCFFFLGLVAAILVPQHFLYPFILLLGIKLLSEFLVLHSANRFFHQKGVMQHFLPVFLLYAGYVVWIGILVGAGGKWAWKGRG